MSVQARCNCGYRMELPDEWAGRQGRCPQCGRVLNIPIKRPSAEPSTAKNVPQAELDRSMDSGIDLTGHSVSRPSAAGDFLSRPVLVSILGGGFVLLIIGVTLVMRNPDRSSQPQTDGGQNDGRPAEPDTPGTDVFRPTVGRSGDSAPGVVDSEPKPKLSAIDKSKDSGTSEPKVKADTGPFALESWGLRDFGITIPPGANVIEIDGVLLRVKNPAELAGQGGVPLVLPYGTHIVRFSKTDAPRVIEPKRWFLDAYRDAAKQVRDGDRWSFDRLLELSRRTLDRFTEPLVPHMWGNYYWQEGQLDAAARHYAWALEIAPTFAPSYLNLASLAHQRGEDDAARRYLRLADLWNAQNAYGLAAVSNGLRASIGVEEEPTEDDQPDWFVAQHGAMTPRDRDMMAVLRSAAEFAPRTTERAKILNNLGAYFEHEGKPELALESYRTAASVFAKSKLEADERRVIHGILENLTRLCRKADMPEYRRYERLQAMVQN